MKVTDKIKQAIKPMWHYESSANFNNPQLFNVEFFRYIFVTTLIYFDCSFKLILFSSFFQVVDVHRLE
ncbi:hypothetical protein ACH3XW_19210 [Acanthocheilonema viteae]